MEFGRETENCGGFVAAGGRESPGVVAVLCGDPIVGRIVTNLLHAIGYESRDAGEISPEDISGVSLLFIAPGAEGEDLGSGLLPFEEAGVRILDLGGGSWPHRIEEIKNAVDEALSTSTDELSLDAAPLDPEPEGA